MSMQACTRQQALLSYRLIDGGCEPHRQLDRQHGSLDEAIADAIAWVEPRADLNQAAQKIGVDVFTGDGNWRPCRLPGPLLCPLLCVLAG
jgi:hypothetical protein